VFALPANAKTTLHRLEDYRFPAYHLTLAANETVSVYLRVNNGKALLTLPLKLLTAEQLISSSNTETLVFAALFAGMLVLALYNLLLLLSLRDYSYLSLVGFIVTSGMMFFHDSNLFPTFAWLNNSQHYFYGLPLVLAIASAFQYWKYINQGENPLMTRLCQWIPPTMLAIIPFIGWLPSADHAIVGIAELFRQTALSNEQTNHLDKLLASSRHLQALVDDVLDLSRIGAGKLELETTTFRLDEELDTLRQMFSLPAAQQGLVLSLTHDIPPNVQVRGDPVRLRQVLVNLLGNALKFTAQGSVSLSVRQIAGNTGQIRLYFEVVDTGIGISRHQQQRLFQPFSQAESSTARRYGGSGLGLAISRKLVHLMGGKLEVESVPDNGSRFFFTLEFPVQATSPDRVEMTDSTRHPSHTTGHTVFRIRRLNRTAS
jgi:hypothetical protein